MKEALLQNPDLHTFRYSNGTTVEIRMTVAGGCIRYVRVFDLPPEISDLEVSLVFGKYGTIKRMVRERFPAELKLDLFTGVRGIYMDIKKEIPSTLFVANRRARLYYEGLKQRCFLCKEEGHLKADCPQNKRRLPEGAAPGVVIPHSEKSITSKNTYADAVIGAATSSRVHEQLQTSMVTLVSSRDGSMRQKQIEGNSIVEVAADRQSDVASKADSEEDTSDEITAEEKEHSNKRPLTASSKSGSDDGGDSFVTVEKNRKSRKQKRCDEDAERPNPLEAIAAASRSDSRVTRSKSKRQQEDRSRSRNATKVSESNAATDIC